MRLICPECQVQYEVDASLIPAQGRDVQCSNCAHMWFVSPAPREPLMPDIRRPATPPDVASPPEREPERERSPEMAGADAAASYRDDRAPDEARYAPGHAPDDRAPVPEAPYAEADPDRSPAEAEIHAFPGSDGGPPAYDDRGDDAFAPDEIPDETPDDAEDGEGDGMPDDQRDRVPSAWDAPLSDDRDPQAFGASDPVVEPTAAGPAAPPEAGSYGAQDAAARDRHDHHDTAPAYPAPVDPTPTDAPHHATPAAFDPYAPGLEDDDDDDGEDGFEPAEGDVVAPPSREHDEAVLGILREEAQREMAHRRRDADPLESQPDLGLDAGHPGPAAGGAPAVHAPGPADTQEPARHDIETAMAGAGAGASIGARVARLRGVDVPEDERTEEEEALAEDRAQSDRAPLPDVDEINSTLRPHAEHASEEPALARRLREEERRRGFRGGFFAVTGLVAALILLYVAAPWVARTFPGLEPAMATYVSGSNAARDGIDGAVDRTLSRLARLTGAD